MEEHLKSDENTMTDQTGDRTLFEGLFYYASIVGKYKWMITIVTFLAAAGSVGFAIISLTLPPESSPLPNRYEANSQLLLQRGANENVSAGMLSALGIDLPGAGGGLDYGGIAMEVVRNRTFIDRIIDLNDAIDRYDITTMVRTTSRKIILANASFDYDSGTGVLSIRYEDTDPVYAAQVVDSIVEELLAWFAARGGSDRLVAVQTMKEKLQEVESQIDFYGNQIEQFQRTYGILQVEEIAQTQSEFLSQFQAQLLQLDLQISNLRAVSTLQNDPELLVMQTQRQNILALMVRIEAGYTGTNELLPPRDELPALAAEYTRLQLDLEIQGRIYQVLTEQYEVAKLTAGTDPAFIVLEPVEIPEEKSGPSRGRLVMMITAGAFFGSIALALFMDKVRKTVKDAAKLRQLEREEA